MRHIVRQYLGGEISRRSFMRRLAAFGLTAPSARSVAGALAPLTEEKAIPESARKTIEGTGGELLAEQLIASGVKYIFGNSGTGDAGFYDALVDRPQLQYILVPHEGPLAAMALGYAKASGQTAYLCVAGMVGMANFIGQMFNAFKNQDNVVFVAYKRESSLVAGRDVHEEVFDQEMLAEPFTKWRWIAKRAATIPEVVRRAFKLASTPPFGPVYLGWNHDLLLEQARAEIIAQRYYDLPMRVRPSAKDVELAAKWLVESESPVLIVGDEVYKARAIEKAVRLAEMLGMPVTTLESCYANFPEDHPLFLGEYSPRMRFPAKQDLVLNVGNRLKLGPSPAPPLIAEGAKFIDLRIDSRHLADVFPTDLALVADVGEGLGDLIAAVEQLLTPALEAKIAARRGAAAAFTARVRKSREAVMRGSEWEGQPILPARLAYELSRALDPDACIVLESAETFGFEFNPLSGRMRIENTGDHLGWAVGAAAGAKLAMPDRQVACLVGDGSFLFGPQALWTMARNEMPVIVVVFNNRSYNGTKNRAIALAVRNRMAETGRIVHYYLGDPDIDMVKIAEGFGVRGERVDSPGAIRPALERAVAAAREGRPYLIDAHVARSGMWAENSGKPWYPKLSVAELRGRKA